MDLGQLAMTFGRIERMIAHPDGRPETDSDHTVMLGWIAPALGELVNIHYGYQVLSAGLIAQFVLVHDAAEVYAGDTPTVRLTEAETQQKEEREAVATAKLTRQFQGRLPWFARTLRDYELQRTREAKFVRAVDKIMPKLVYMIDGGASIRLGRVTRAEFVAMVAKQRPDIARWLGNGARLVLDVYDILCSRVLSGWPEEPLPPAFPQPATHKLRVAGTLVSMLHHECLHPADSVTCPFTVAYEQATRTSSTHLAMLPQGEFEVTLDERGELVFVDTEGE